MPTKHQMETDVYGEANKIIIGDYFEWTHSVNNLAHGYLQSQPMNVYYNSCDDGTTSVEKQAEPEIMNFDLLAIVKPTPGCPMYGEYRFNAYLDERLTPTGARGNGTCERASTIQLEPKPVHNACLRNQFEQQESNLVRK
ncbi:MAG TPA: hypothetical protein VLS48_06370 [Anaerolineales bacterium]|nr:hypothetical protein [Anaerolineales bacterium]